MEISKQEWEDLRNDVRRAKNAAEQAINDRGHTFIIFALIVLLIRGC